MTRSNPQGKESAGGTDARCGQYQLPPREPRLERVHAQTLKTQFAMQRARYAENPPRTFTFSDLYRQHPDCHDTFMQGDNMPIMQAFAYRLNSMYSDDDRIIPIPREKFWCLLRPMTALLLSDRRIQHYTMVYRIDHDKQTIDLLDNWPDKIFLKKGLNSRGVEARIIELENLGKLVRITRREFEKVVIGALTSEPPDFHEHLVKVIPSGRGDPGFMLALSIITLGERISTEDIGVALPYAMAAFELAREKPDKMPPIRAARQLLYAVRFGYYWLSAKRIDPETDDGIGGDLATAQGLLSAGFPDLDVDALSDYQIVRLGQMAYHIYQLQDAEYYFSIVVQRSPDNPMGHFGRAKTRNRMMDNQGVIADSTACIRLIQRSAGDIRDVPATDPDYVYHLIEGFEKSYETRKFDYMLPESYVLRGNAHLQAGDFGPAESDGRNAINMNPKDFQGYITVAASLHGRGRHYQSLPFYSMVIQLSSRMELKYNIHGYMQQVLEQAIQSDPDMQHGLINQDTILFRREEDMAAFLDTCKKDQHGALKAENYICILPKKSYVLIHGEKKPDCLEVEGDAQLIRSPKWSEATSTEEIGKGFVRGWIPGFAVDVLPQKFWQTHTAGLLADRNK